MYMYLVHRYKHENFFAVIMGKFGFRYKRDDAIFPVKPEIYEFCFIILSFSK